MKTNNSLADDLLRQVPLIKNPLFQPPKPVTLNANYNKLIPTLSNTVIPPRLNMEIDDLKHWQQDLSLQIQLFDLKSDSNIADINSFNEWVSAKKTKVAPGFDSVIHPVTVKSPVSLNKNTKNDINDNDDNTETINELQNVFAKANLNN